MADDVLPFCATCERHSLEANKRRSLEKTRSSIDYKDLLERCFNFMPQSPFICLKCGCALKRFVSKTKRLASAFDEICIEISRRNPTYKKPKRNIPECFYDDIVGKSKIAAQAKKTPIVESTKDFKQLLEEQKASKWGKNFVPILPARAVQPKPPKPQAIIFIPNPSVGSLVSPQRETAGKQTETKTGGSKSQPSPCHLYLNSRAEIFDTIREISASYESNGSVCTTTTNQLTLPPTENNLTPKQTVLVNDRSVHQTQATTGVHVTQQGSNQAPALSNSVVSTKVGEGFNQLSSDKESANNIVEVKVKTETVDTNSLSVRTESSVSLANTGNITGSRPTCVENIKHEPRSPLSDRDSDGKQPYNSTGAVGSEIDHSQTDSLHSLPSESENAEHSERTDKLSVFSVKEEPMEIGDQSVDVNCTTAPAAMRTKSRETNHLVIASVTVTPNITTSAKLKSDVEVVSGKSRNLTSPTANPGSVVTLSPCNIPRLPAVTPRMPVCVPQRTISSADMPLSSTLSQPQTQSVPCKPDSEQLYSSSKWQQKDRVKKPLSRIVRKKLLEDLKTEARLLSNDKSLRMNQDSMHSSVFTLGVYGEFVKKSAPLLHSVLCTVAGCYRYKHKVRTDPRLTFIVATLMWLRNKQLCAAHVMTGLLLSEASCDPVVIDRLCALGVTVSSSRLKAQKHKLLQGQGINSSEEEEEEDVDMSDDEENSSDDGDVCCENAVDFHQKADSGGKGDQASDQSVRTNHHREISDLQYGESDIMDTGS